MGSVRKSAQSLGLAGLVVFALVACSDSHETPRRAPRDAGDGSTPPKPPKDSGVSADGATPAGDGGVSRDGSAASADGGSVSRDGAPDEEDAGPDLPESDDVLRSTPGRVVCDSDRTTYADDCPSFSGIPNNQPGQPFCCVRTDRDYCVGGNVQGCGAGKPYYCDEDADCDSGLHCCATPGRWAFRCQASCDGEIQLCKRDTECENRQPCTAYLCDGLPLATCGALDEEQRRLLSMTSALAGEPVGCPPL